jgi:flagellar assembly factor FliW
LKNEQVFLGSCQESAAGESFEVIILGAEGKKAGKFSVANPFLFRARYVFGV